MAFLNPMQVNMGNPGSTGKPYVGSPTTYWGSKPVGRTNPWQAPSLPQPASTTVGPQAVRATGSGPFDATYRQNLATYAGGLFQNPTGTMNINPTGNISGQATTGGNAPQQGMPTTQVSAAIGGNPFSFAPPSTPQVPTLQQWLTQFMKQGSNLGLNYGNLT
jgi:hypothetical protein